MMRIMREYTLIFANICGYAHRFTTMHIGKICRMAVPIWNAPPFEPPPDPIKAHLSPNLIWERRAASLSPRLSIYILNLCLIFLWCLFVKRYIQSLLIEVSSLNFKHELQKLSIFTQVTFYWWVWFFVDWGLVPNHQLQSKLEQLDKSSVRVGIQT